MSGPRAPMSAPNGYMDALPQVTRGAKSTQDQVDRGTDEEGEYFAPSYTAEI